MFPIRDHNPSGRTPYVTFALIGLNVVVFLMTFGVATEAEIVATYYTYGIVPAESAGRPFTLVTSMFLHGGFMHLAGNMLFLWVFGDNLEDVMGHLGFTLFYFAGGIGAGLLQIASDPGSGVPVVGASGAISAVLGGYMLLYPKARVDVLIFLVFIIRIVPIPAWLVLGAWFALQIFSGLSVDTTGGGVAYWAHAGGFAVGLVLTLPTFLRLGGPAFWQAHHGLPPHPEGSYRWQRSGVPRVPRR